MIPDATFDVILLTMLLVNGDTESPHCHHFPDELFLVGVPQANTALFSREHVGVSVRGGDIDLDILTDRDIRGNRYGVSFDGGYATGYGKLADVFLHHECHFAAV